MSLSPQSRDPQLLCPCVRSRYLILVREAAERGGVGITLIETLRQIDRQTYYVRIGASRTVRSMHLGQPPNDLALAFDVAPTEYLSERAWHPEGKVWTMLGEIGESLGLEWGGRWQGFSDLPHFQLRRCAC